MYISLIYSTLNRIIEMWEVESLNYGCMMVLIPQGSPLMMSRNDEIFWSSTRRICSAWFVEDVKKWAATVDDQAAHEQGSLMAQMKCEEWENWIMTLLESNLTGDSWRLRKWMDVNLSSRMSTFFSSPDDENDPYTLYSLNGESVRDWFRRITPQICDGSFTSSSVISLSSGNSSTVMSPPSLTGSEKEVMISTMLHCSSKGYAFKAKCRHQEDVG